MSIQVQISFPKVVAFENKNDQDGWWYCARKAKKKKKKDLKISRYKAKKF